MRFMRISILILVLLLSRLALADNCIICLEDIPKGTKFCKKCREILSKEEQQAKDEKKIVSQLVKAREDYDKTLRQLIQFYINRGDYAKLQDAREEFKELKSVTKYDYVVLAQVVGVNLKPTKNIEEANTLYADGVAYKEYPDLFNKKRRLKDALAKFQEIIKNYPDSDKVDESAYMIAEIYSGNHFKDYRRAAIYYEKCFQWNPHTKLPARFKAATMYDQKLKEYSKAAQLYLVVKEQSPFSENRKRARERLDQLEKIGFVP